jgi:hypothetical protein
MSVAKNGVIDKSMFYVSGAACIPRDAESRVWGYNRFIEEELNDDEREKCYSMYVDKNGVKVMLSHDCPKKVANIIYNSHKFNIIDEVVHNKVVNENEETEEVRENIVFESTTNILLNQMFAASKPLIWIFGHHHQSVRFRFRNCLFIGLNELETIKITTGGDLV